MQKKNCNQSQNKFGMKSPIFGGTLKFRQLKPKYLDPFTKNSYFDKIFVPEKNSRFYLQQAEVVAPPPLPFFGKKPGSLRV